MKIAIPDTLCLTSTVEVSVISVNKEAEKAVLKLTNDLALTFTVVEGDLTELVGKKAILDKDGTLVAKPEKQKVNPERKTTTGCMHGEKIGGI